MRRFRNAMRRVLGKRLRGLIRVRDKGCGAAEAKKYVPVDDFDTLARAAFSPSLTYSENVARLRSFRFAVPADFPSDPASQEFREYQMQLYKGLSGRPYDPPKTERANGLSLVESLKDPFPYCTKDAAVIGSYMMGIGHIVRVVGTKPACRILEFGPGWGHATLALARSGYEVTAVDIEPIFVELINTLAAQHNCIIETHCGSFLDIPTSGKFDVILFFECFHHCFDHSVLLERLKAVLNPGGRILLCNEPIGNDLVPYPWGIRLDGHALWAIRTHGWMELGFKEDYLVKLFAARGFTLTKHLCTPAGEAGVIFEFELNRGIVNGEGRS
jgi:2-polyprenyl-3-methyl-5-hydroxy-6-metoxy-1,4-benzoquinol methylase